MRINSGRKAIIGGIVYGLVAFTMFVLFTAILHWRLGGEHFIYKMETREVVNGISFTLTQIIAVIISAMIPIFLLRCSSAGYFIISIFVAILLYIILFAGIFVTPGMSNYMLELIKKSPVNSFDALVYGGFNFPVGAVVGLIITAIINYIIYRKNNGI